MYRRLHSLIIRLVYCQTLGAVELTSRTCQLVENFRRLTLDLVHTENPTSELGVNGIEAATVPDIRRATYMERI